MKFGRQQKFQKCAYTLFPSHMMKLSSIFALWAAAKLGHWQKFHIHTFATQGVEIELIVALRAAFSEIWADFQNCHIWE